MRPLATSISDTRAAYRRILGRLDFHSGLALLKFVLCLAAAAATAFLPAFPGLAPDARWSLAIVTFAALLWVTEAIPAFAVSLLAIGLQIAFLGNLADPQENGSPGWERFVEPWASPSMWLFFGGFILARAASRSGLDLSIATRLLHHAGPDPSRVLLAAMGTSFVFSMFLSNTATAAMMLAVLAPVLARSDNPDAARALTIGVAFAANLGGMGTIIGTPPNAIAAALLADTTSVDFLRWMLLGLPPALVLLAALWFALARRVRGAQFSIPAPAAASTTPPSADTAGSDPPVRTWQRGVVLAVIATTVGLWLTTAWHGLPTAVISFVPIVVLSITGVVRAADLRALDWDILVLIAGGLSLGVGVAETGLATWVAGQLDVLDLPLWLLATTFAALTLVLSNFMSNTAASNILIPMGIAAGTAASGSLGAAAFAVPMALSASAAMLLPISTPPNAIAYAQRNLRTTDFLLPGALVGIAGTALALLWGHLALGWFPPPTTLTGTP